MKFLNETLKEDKWLTNKNLIFYRFFKVQNQKSRFLEPGIVFDIDISYLSKYEQNQNITSENKVRIVNTSIRDTKSGKELIRILPFMKLLLFLHYFKKSDT